MISNLKKLLVGLLITTQAFAGLPPTTSEGSADATPITTFNYFFPNFTGTHTGTTFSLGVNSILGGGTGQTTANGAFNALSPLTTKGDTTTFGTVNQRHAVPGDNGKLTPDSSQTDGWRSSTYLETNGRPGKNYIQYGDAENGQITGWAQAQIGTMVNGIPTGTPTFNTANFGSFAASNTLPVSGSNAFLMNTISPGGAGDAVCSSAMTLDVSDRGHVLNLVTNYATSGTAVNLSGTSSNTYAMAVADVTGGSFVGWVPVNAPFNFTGTGTYTSSIQPNTTTTAIRECIYMPTTPGSFPVNLAFDDVFVGRIASNSGPAMTDPVSYTATWTGAGTVTNVNNGLQWSRVGPLMHVYGEVQFGTVTASTLTFTLPNGLTVNAPTSGGNFYSVGRMEPNTATSSLVKDFTVLATNGSNVLYFGVPEYSQAVNPLSPILGNSWISNSAGMSVDAWIPISGWTSGVNQSSDVGNATQAMTSDTTGGSTFTNTAVYVAPIVNSSGAGFTVDAVNHRISCTSSGLVGVSANAQIAFSGTGNLDIKIRKNGTPIVASGASAVSTSYTNLVLPEFTLTCSQNDYFDFTVDCNAGACATSGTHNFVYGYLNVKKIQNGLTNQGTDTIAARYSGIPTGTIATTFAGAGSITFPTKTYDLQGAWNGTTYTVPVTGKYSLKGVVGVGATYAVGNESYVALTVNGVQIANYPNQAGGVQGNIYCPVSDEYNFNQGDLITFRVVTNGTSPSFTSNALYHHMAIMRVGN